MMLRHDEPFAPPEIVIQRVAYHRNGIDGTGFFVVLFEHVNMDKGGQMVALVFDEPGHVAVLDASKIVIGGDVSVRTNSWRGDDFEPTLRSAIAAFSEDGAVDA